ARNLGADAVEGGAELRSDDILSAYRNQAQVGACIRAKLVEDIGTARCVIALDDRQRIDPRGPLVLDGMAARLRRFNQHLDRAAIENVRFARNLGGRPAAYAIMGDATSAEGIKLVFDRPAPTDTTDILDLHIHRRPLEPMEDPGDEPEIGLVHHDALPYWALHLAFLHRDTDAEDPQRAADMAARFTARFGIRVDANVARKQRRRRAPVVRP